MRFNEKVQADFDRLQARKRELSARLISVSTEIAQAKVNRGAFIAEGCNKYQEYNDQLYKLRAEQEGLQDAIDYLSNQAGILKRSHTWITSQ